MESDPFKSTKAESDTSSESDSDSSSKKKKKIRRLPILPGNEQAATETTEAKPKILEAPESLWKKLVGAPTEEKTSESTGETDETTETVGEQPEALEGAEAPLEELSPAEQAEIAEQYIEARLEQLEYEQTNPAEDGSESGPAEQAADIALLQAIRNRMRLDQEASVDEHVEAAYDHAITAVGSGTAYQSVRPPETITPVEARAAVPASPYATFEAAPLTTPPVVERAPAKVAEKTTTEIYENRTGTALLVGGAVGYLIGRRRGRINTEKEMKSLEKKMTTKVEVLERTIRDKEQQIRAVVREKIPAITNRSPETTPKSPVPAKEMLGLVSLKAMEAAPLKPAVRLEKLAAKKPTPEKAASVKTMPRNELLEFSEKIEVGSTNLRRVYETNLISEQSLRRLVEAKGQGGDIRAMLEREMVEKEMSYERDPRLRNSGAVGSLAAGGAVKVLVDSGLADSVQRKVDDDRKESNEANAPSTENVASKQPVAAYVTVLTLVLVIGLLLYLLFTSN